MPATAKRLRPGEPFNAILPRAHWRDQRDLMERPFFSLSKACRIVPISYRSSDVQIHVVGKEGCGIATIWDADILIWATSQIVAALERGLTPSPHMRAIPYQMLQDLSRDIGKRQYILLKQSLDRLQTTTVTTTLRSQGEGANLPFSWITDWHECVTRSGRHEGIEFTLADWLYRGAIDRTKILSLHSGYFQLTGGLERWLYCVARKHAGKQKEGWRFSLRQLHHKSGSISRYSNFALAIRQIVQRQPLPDYRLTLIRAQNAELLHMVPRLARPVDTQ